AWIPPRRDHMVRCDAAMAHPASIVICPMILPIWCFSMPPARLRRAPHMRIEARLARTSKVGALPEWNLADLYPALEAPEVKRDLERADADCMAFEDAYKGRLADMARRPDAAAALAGAVRRFEEIDELIGRLVSYAGLVHASDTTDPVRAKFYGDVQERITA